MVELQEGAVGAQPLKKRLLIHQQPSQEQLQERLDGAEAEVGVWLFSTSGNTSKFGVFLNAPAMAIAYMYYLYFFWGFVFLHPTEPWF